MSTKAKASPSSALGTVHSIRSSIEALGCCSKKSQSGKRLLAFFKVALESLKTAKRRAELATEVMMASLPPAARTSSQSAKGLPPPPPPPISHLSLLGPISVDLVSCDDLSRNEWCYVMDIIKLLDNVRSVDVSLTTVFETDAPLRHAFIQMVHSSKSIEEVVSTDTNLVLACLPHISDNASRNLQRDRRNDDQKRVKAENGRERTFQRKMLSILENELANRQLLDEQERKEFIKQCGEFKVLALGRIKHDNLVSRQQNLLENISAVVYDSCVLAPSTLYRSFIGILLDTTHHLESTSRSELFTLEDQCRIQLRRRYYKGHENASWSTAGRQQSEKKVREDLLREYIHIFKRSIVTNEKAQRERLEKFHAASTVRYEAAAESWKMRKVEIAQKVAFRKDELLDRQKIRGDRSTKERKKHQGIFNVENEKLDKLESGSRAKIILEETVILDAMFAILNSLGTINNAHLVVYNSEATIEAFLASIVSVTAEKAVLGEAESITTSPSKTAADHHVNNSLFETVSTTPKPSSVGMMNMMSMSELTGSRSYMISHSNTNNQTASSRNDASVALAMEEAAASLSLHTISISEQPNALCRLTPHQQALNNWPSQRMEYIKKAIYARLPIMLTAHRTAISQFNSALRKNAQIIREQCATINAASGRIKISPYETVAWLQDDVLNAPTFSDEAPLIADKVVTAAPPSVGSPTSNPVAGNLTSAPTSLPPLSLFSTLVNDVITMRQSILQARITCVSIQGNLQVDWRDAVEKLSSNNVVDNKKKARNMKKCVETAADRVCVSLEEESVTGATTGTTSILEVRRRGASSLSHGYQYGGSGDLISSYLELSDIMDLMIDTPPCVRLTTPSITSPSVSSASPLSIPSSMLASTVNNRTTSTPPSPSTGELHCLVTATFPVVRLRGGRFFLESPASASVAANFALAAFEKDWSNSFRPEWRWQRRGAIRRLPPGVGDVTETTVAEPPQRAYIQVGTQSISLKDSERLVTRLNLSCVFLPSPFLEPFVYRPLPFSMSPVVVALPAKSINKTFLEEFEAMVAASEGEVGSSTLADVVRDIRYTLLIQVAMQDATSLPSPPRKSSLVSASHWTIASESSFLISASTDKPFTPSHQNLSEATSAVAGLIRSVGSPFRIVDGRLVRLDDNNSPITAAKLKYLPTIANVSCYPTQTTPPTNKPASPKARGGGVAATEAAATLNTLLTYDDMIEGRGPMNGCTSIAVNFSREEAHLIEDFIGSLEVISCRRGHASDEVVLQALVSFELVCDTANEHVPHDAMVAVTAGCGAGRGLSAYMRNKGDVSPFSPIGQASFLNLLFTEKPHDCSANNVASPQTALTDIAAGSKHRLSCQIMSIECFRELDGVATITCYGPDSTIFAEVAPTNNSEGNASTREVRFIDSNFVEVESSKGQFLRFDLLDVSELSKITLGSVHIPVEDALKQIGVGFRHYEIKSTPFATAGGVDAFENSAKKGEESTSKKAESEHADEFTLTEVFLVTVAVIKIQFEAVISKPLPVKAPWLFTYQRPAVPSTQAQELYQLELVHLPSAPPRPLPLVPFPIAPDTESLLRLLSIPRTLSGLYPNTQLLQSLLLGGASCNNTTITAQSISSFPGNKKTLRCGISISLNRISEVQYTQLGDTLAATMTSSAMPASASVGQSYSNQHNMLNESSRLATNNNLAMSQIQLQGSSASICPTAPPPAITTPTSSRQGTLNTSSIDFLFIDDLSDWITIQPPDGTPLFRSGKKINLFTPPWATSHVASDEDLFRDVTVVIESSALPSALDASAARSTMKSGSPSSKYSLSASPPRKGGKAGGIATTASQSKLRILSIELYVTINEQKQLDVKALEEILSRLAAMVATDLLPRLRIDEQGTEKELQASRHYTFDLRWMIGATTLTKPDSSVTTINEIIDWTHRQGILGGRSLEASELGVLGNNNKTTTAAGVDSLPEAPSNALSPLADIDPTTTAAAEIDTTTLPNSVDTIERTLSGLTDVASTHVDSASTVATFTPGTNSTASQLLDLLKQYRTQAPNAPMDFSLIATALSLTNTAPITATLELMESSLRHGASWSASLPITLRPPVIRWMGAQSNLIDAPIKLKGDGTTARLPPVHVNFFPQSEMVSIVINISQAPPGCVLSVVKGAAESTSSTPQSKKKQAVADPFESVTYSISEDNRILTLKPMAAPVYEEINPEGYTSGIPSAENTVTPYCSNKPPPLAVIAPSTKKQGGNHATNRNSLFSYVLPEHIQPPYGEFLRSYVYISCTSEAATVASSSLSATTQQSPVGMSEEPNPTQPSSAVTYGTISTVLDTSTTNIPPTSDIISFKITVDAVPSTSSSAQPISPSAAAPLAAA